MYCPNCGHEAGQASIYCARCGRRLGNPPTGDEESSKSTPAMKGRVVAFDWRSVTGIISGDDGNRYRFTGQEWRSSDQPRPGMDVDFLPDGSDAGEVYWWSRLSFPGAASKRLMAGLLAIFTGWLGLHKFYLGYKSEGVLLLLAGAVGWFILTPMLVIAMGWVVFPVVLLLPLVVLVVSIIEGVIYLNKTDEEFDRLYVQRQRAWF